MILSSYLQQTKFSGCYWLFFEAMKPIEHLEFYSYCFDLPGAAFFQLLTHRLDEPTPIFSVSK